MPADDRREVTRSGWFAALRRALGVLWDADPLTLAASIAFYTSLSFAPVVVLALAAIAALSPGEERALVGQITGLFGAQVGGAAQVVVDNADTSALRWNVGGLIAAGALLVSATSAFAQLQEAINRVWGIAAGSGNAVRSWLRRRLFSLGILAAIGFLLITALVVSTLLALVLTREGIGWAIANELVTLAVLALAFACLYRFVPDDVPPWQGALLGGLVTAVLFESGKWALGAYLGTTTSDDAYGGASALVLLLLWVYYSALIVLVGAGATHALSLRFGWQLAARHRGVAPGREVGRPGSV
jgi:membrane protein